MNILFLTMNTFTGIEMHNIYSDLMKEFIVNGHRPYIVTPRERRKNEETELVDCETYSILKVKIGNTSDVSLIEKGISTITLNWKYRNAIKKYLGKVPFGLILYSTPPITVAGTIKQLKSYYKSPTYLMLKDIFPQNAADLGMIGNGGLLYKYFRSQEKTMYRESDKIGCMSPANVDYVIAHNKYIDPCKVEVCPNAITPKLIPDKAEARKRITTKYCIPGEAVIYMYGGNLGKPQGIPFLVEVLKQMKDDIDSFFFVCGSGSEFEEVDAFVNKYKPHNVILNKELPKEEYDDLLSGCDVGMIFLDYRFTIPNFPSRMLSYMEQEMPMVAFTDEASDVGKTAIEGQFGWWGPSNDAKKAADLIKYISKNKDKIQEYGKTARSYLEKYFTATVVYETIKNAIDLNVVMEAN